MITAKEDSYEEIGTGLQPRIEVMIWNSSLDDKVKEHLMTQMLSLRTTEQAQAMINMLEEFQPVPGVHRTPITLYEIIQATRERADRDDFQERRKWN